MADGRDNRTSRPKAGLLDAVVWIGALAICAGLAWVLAQSFGLSVEGVRRAEQAFDSALKRIGEAERAPSPPPQPEAPRTCDLSEADLKALSFSMMRPDDQDTLVPAWKTRPAPEYPRSAWENGVESGHAVVSCLAMPDGRVAHCRVIEESPPGAGFGPQAVAAACQATTEPQTIGGEPQPSNIRFTVHFATGE